MARLNSVDHDDGRAASATSPPISRPCEFLGELFFNFLVKEIQSEVFDEKIIKLCDNTRYDIMQFYDLARAAKVLRNT